MRELQLDGRDCRGRNKWFTSHTADVFESGVANGSVSLHVFSKQIGGTAPIIVNFSPADARAVAAALVALADELEPVQVIV